MMYFFAGHGFKFESIVGWNFRPAKYQEMEGDKAVLNAPELHVFFSDRTPIFLSGREAENLNDMLKSKALVIEFDDEDDEDIAAAAPHLEALIKAAKERFAKAQEE